MRSSSCSSAFRCVRSSQQVTSATGCPAASRTRSERRSTGKRVPSRRTFTVSRLQLVASPRRSARAERGCSAGAKMRPSFPTSASGSQPCIRASAGLL